MNECIHFQLLLVIRQGSPDRSRGCMLCVCVCVRVCVYARVHACIVCINICKEIYHKRSAHVIMEADKSPDLPRAGGRPRADSVGPVPSLTFSRPMKSQRFSLSSKAGKKPNVPSQRQSGSRNLPLLMEGSDFLLCSDL